MAITWHQGGISRTFIDSASLGQIKGASAFVQNGANRELKTALEDIWSEGGIYPWPTAASAITLVSDSANDTADGTGAQIVTVHGLDANWVAISEDIVLSGTTASAPSTQAFLRIHNLQVKTCGSYTGANAGTVKCKAAGTETVLAAIPVSLNGTIQNGRSQLSMWSVPKDHILLIYTFYVSTFASKRVTVDCWIRPGGDKVTAPFTPKQAVIRLEGVQGLANFNYPVPYVIPEKTDIWVSAFTDIGTAEVAMGYSGILVETR